MFKRLFAAAFLIFIFTVVQLSQDTTPTPAPSAAATQMAQMQDQIDLLKKQQEYEKAKSDLANQRLRDIMNSLPKEFSTKVPEGKTAFTTVDKPSAESVALSYEALKELSAQIEAAMHAPISKYSRVVIYNEFDFFNLAKYRLYRSQSDAALKNYAELLKRLKGLVEEKAVQPDRTGEFTTKSIDPVTTFLSMPAIGTSFARSVADMIAVFRSDTTVYESSDTIDEGALGAAIANELQKGNPDLKIYYPKEFVPEFDLESESDSILTRIALINAAKADIEDFLDRCGDLTPAQQNIAGIKDIIAYAKTVKKQLEALALLDEPVSGAKTRSGDDSGNRRENCDLRQLVRAEKLDNFMRLAGSDPGNGRVGILKLRSRASGGSRRETRNLFLGNRISYSGSVTLEVLLFDLDGTLRISDIFSLHTGFRKLKAAEK